MIHFGFVVSLAGIWITCLILNNNVKRWQDGEHKHLLIISTVVMILVQTALSYYAVWYLKQTGVI